MYLWSALSTSAIPRPDGAIFLYSNAIRFLLQPRVFLWHQAVQIIDEALILYQQMKQSLYVTVIASAVVKTV